MNQAILEYQQRCWKNYKSDIELPENYTYLYGNPVKVHVPVDVATEGLMIVGAYPTAQFNTIGKHRDVPVNDHLYPFSNDTYFDGSRVRQVKSGEELEEFYLKKIDYPRSKCWITDLVKVFLFKDGHIAKYYDLEFSGFVANRKNFVTLAKSEKNMKYLFDEIELASPKVILLLSEEVTSVVMNVNRNEANKLLKSGINEILVRGKIYKVLACPHPGILMRGGEAGEKWRRVSENQLSILQKLLT
jgi:uracil-DNA glycosylase